MGAPRRATWLLACGWFAACAAPGPRLELREGEAAGAVFAVAGLSRAELETLRAEARTAAQWRAVLAVYVDGTDGAQPLLGRHRVADGALQFVPRFPLQAGLGYRAVFDPPPLVGGRRGARLERTFVVPPAPPGPPPRVVAVHPSAAELPENVLRFYVHFSAPMRQGDVYRHVRLLRDDGSPVDLPFLQLAEELWDPSGTRLTLLCDPGRVKRGLLPREQEGPILEQGRRFALVVDGGWPGADGQPIGADHRVEFAVGAPDGEQPDPARWRLRPPAAATREPLVVQLGQPLDHALLHRMLWVEGPGGRVEGEVTVEPGDRAWRFRPRSPWRSGAYLLVADTALEDPSGNSIRAPFEVDVAGRAARAPEVETVTLSFRTGTVSDTFSSK